MDREELLTRLDAEGAAFLAVLARIEEPHWRERARADGWTIHDIAAHVADSTYGLALMALGEIPPAGPLNPQTGWMDIDEVNAQRRAKNAALPREKVISRSEAALGHARRAINDIPDLDAPGPLGPIYSCGEWLRRLIVHLGDHRAELEQLI